MKKLFLMLLITASTNVLFGVPPHQNAHQQIQVFTVQRVHQAAQTLPLQRNTLQQPQGQTRPLQRTTALANRIDANTIRMAPFLNHFRLPRRLPTPQQAGNRLSGAQPLDDSQESDALLLSDDESMSLSLATEDRENRARIVNPTNNTPIALFLNDFQVPATNTGAAAIDIDAVTAQILTQIRT